MALRAGWGMVYTCRATFDLPVKPAPYTPAARFGDPFRVGNVTCVNCGYVLRGLRMDGRCPECGGEIRASLEEVRLRHAQPLRLRFVQCGVIGMAVWPVVIVGACLFAANAASTLLSLQVMIGAGVWVTLAVLLVTIRPTRSAATYPVDDLRRWARLQLATAVVFGVGTGVAADLPSLGGLFVSGVICAGAVSLLGWTLLKYAGSIARLCVAGGLTKHFAQLLPWYLALVIGSIVTLIGVVLGELGDGGPDLMALMVTPLVLLAIPSAIVGAVSAFVVAVSVLVRGLTLAGVLQRAINDGIALREAQD